MIRKLVLEYQRPALDGPDRIRSRLRAAASVTRQCYHLCLMALSLALAPASHTRPLGLHITRG
jgi:hypothetical protein